MNTNNPVITPIGPGTFQGKIVTMDSKIKYLVRLPVNETTQPHLWDANCLTRHAVQSGLWLFDSSEVEAAK
jgi:hypothetical protein